MPLTDLGAHLTTFLASSGIGLTAGTNLFRGQFPQNVLDGVLVIETGGQRSDRPLAYVVRTVQITCRSLVYDSAMTRARQIYDLLNEPPTTRLMTTSRVTYSKAYGPPANIGQDERQAFRIVLNFDFHVGL